MNRREIGWARGLGMVFATTVFVCGCGDKPLTTQPLTPAPIPTRGPSTVSMEVTLSPTTPPAGVKHAALAVVVVRETGGRTVQLTGMRASAYFGDAALQVIGFTPVQLAAGQTASFTVTLTAGADIECVEGVAFSISSADQASAFDIVGCETVDWPF